MREILFRGKRTDNGKWVYGDLIDVKFIFDKNYDGYDSPYYDDELGIIDGHLLEVIPETVGQYTGLTDKNGKKIFEGDIVLIGERRRPVEIVFKNGRFGYLCNDTCITVQYKNPEVIGNIFDKECNDV